MRDIGNLPSAKGKTKEKQIKETSVAAACTFAILYVVQRPKLFATQRTTLAASELHFFENFPSFLPSSSNKKKRERKKRASSLFDYSVALWLWRFERKNVNSLGLTFVSSSFLLTFYFYFYFDLISGRITSLSFIPSALCVIKLSSISLFLAWCTQADTASIQARVVIYEFSQR